MKIIFMGTPEFAVNILESLYQNHEVVLVVTQPDSYNKKKKQFIESPVKIWAKERNLKVLQPEKIKVDFDEIINIETDFIITAAYGQILGKAVLDHPKIAALNVHGSILPKYRGGAPIQRAIMNGDDETGVSIIYMASKMDAGDILKIEKIPILATDNQKTIFDKLSIIGAKLILDVINNLDSITPVKQVEEEVTFACNIKKEDELISFEKDADTIFNLIRGLNPNPGAYFIIDSLILKVYNSKVLEKKHYTRNGTILSINKDSFEISCNNNTIISILEVQLPSKNRMSAKEFINGAGRKILSINKEI